MRACRFVKDANPREQVPVLRFMRLRSCVSPTGLRLRSVAVSRTRVAPSACQCCSNHSFYPPSAASKSTPCVISPLWTAYRKSGSFVSRIARPLLCTDYCTHHSHVPAACHPPRPTPRSPPRTTYLNCCRIELIVSASTSEYFVSTEMRNSASVSVSSTRRAGACRLLEQQRFAVRVSHGDSRIWRWTATRDAACTASASTSTATGR